MKRFWVTPGPLLLFEDCVLNTLVRSLLLNISVESGPRNVQGRADVFDAVAGVGIH